MIGMDMGFEGREQSSRPSSLDQRRIAPDLLEDRIDQHRLAGALVAER